MAKLLYIITVVLTSWIKVSLLTDVLFILPDNPANTSCPSQPCATLSQYLLDNNGTLPVLSNVEYHLLPGEHHVPLYHGFFSLYNFTFAGITGQYSPPVVLISCLKSFLKIFDSQYVIIRNIIFKPCQTIQSYQQHNGVKTNLLLDTCFSCIVENVTFFEYGLIGQNLLGRSSLSNMVIDLTITVTGTYLNYHGIALYYSSLQSRNLENYSIACMLNAVSIYGYGSKHLPQDSNIGNDLHSIVITIDDTNYHITIVISNCHFHDTDQSLMSIISLNSATNNTVLIKNCIFEYIRSLVSLEPVIKIHMFSFSTTLSISNCDFHHIASLYSTLEIMINPLTYKLNDAKVFIKACSFFDNNNPLLFIRGHEPGSDFLQLGPIEVKLTNCREGVFYHTMKIISMTALIQGPVTIDNNQSPDSLLTFEKCNITFSDKIMFTTNTCSSLITLKSGTSFVKLTQNSTIAFSDNYISNEIIDVDNDRYNNPYPYCIFQFISSQNIYTNTTPSILPTNYRIIFDRNQDTR